MLFFEYHWYTQLNRTFQDQEDFMKADKDAYLKLAGPLDNAGMDASKLAIKKQPLIVLHRIQSGTSSYKLASCNAYYYLFLLSL